MRTWPVFEDEAHRFYASHLSRPRSLLAEFTASGTGSGRRAGPRDLLWQAVATSTVAALEAGLEDLIFAAHAARLNVEGDPIRSRTNSPDANPRAWLVEARLMAPSVQKLERVLFADFGLMLGSLPTSARFTALTKDEPNRGSGRGNPRPGPTHWTDLRRYLEVLNYIRNATAHADARKLVSPPDACEGKLWVAKSDGTWSVQQPYGLTGIRSALAVYNTVAEALNTTLGRSTNLSLHRPDDVDFPNR